MSFLGTFSALSKNGYQAIGSQWEQVQSISFPSSVTVRGLAFNADGSYMAITSIAAPTGIGTVHIYYNDGSGTNWILQQSIVGTSDFFGEFLSFSDDGSYIAIGAPNEDTSPYTNNGACHIYTRSGTTWNLQQILLASDRASNDEFGSTVSLNGTATNIIIGAPNEDTSPTTNNGAAYIFTRSGTTWTQQTKLTAPTKYTNGYFGNSLQMSQDGLYVIIGSPGNVGAQDAGAAYIYRWNGTSWVLNQSYTNGIAGYLAGRTVNINNNGSLVAIRYAGIKKLYVYTRTGTTWASGQIIDYSAYSPITVNNSTNEGTGMQGNGNNIILGTWVNNKAIIINNDLGTYNITQDLLSNPQPNPDEFGVTVAIARTANICGIISAGSAISTKTVYVYIKQ